MADVTHYQRARKWLDDPDTKIPDDLRAELNASLAVSVAMREAGSEIRYFSNRLYDLLDSVLEPVPDAISDQRQIRVKLSVKGIEQFIDSLTTGIEIHR